MIIQRKTPQATEAARATLRHEASRKQKVLDPNSLIAAAVIILGPSLPSEGYPADEVRTVYRLRWRSERAFKRGSAWTRSRHAPSGRHELG